MILLAFYVKSIFISTLFLTVIGISEDLFGYFIQVLILTVQ